MHTCRWCKLLLNNVFSWIKTRTDLMKPNSKIDPFVFFFFNDMKVERKSHVKKPNNEPKANKTKPSKTLNETIVNLLLHFSSSLAQARTIRFWLLRNTVRSNNPKRYLFSSLCCSYCWNELCVHSCAVIGRTASYGSWFEKIILLSLLWS